jgi:hypothetical protein
MFKNVVPHFSATNSDRKYCLPDLTPQSLWGNMAFLILNFMNVPILSNFHSICLARSPHWLTGKLAGNPNSWWDTLDTCLNKPALSSKKTARWQDYDLFAWPQEGCEPGVGSSRRIAFFCVPWPKGAGRGKVGDSVARLYEICWFLFGSDINIPQILKDRSI